MRRWDSVERGANIFWGTISIWRRSDAGLVMSAFNGLILSFSYTHIGWQIYLWWWTAEFRDIQMLIQEVCWYELIHRKTSLHLSLHRQRYVLSLATHGKIAHTLSDPSHTLLRWGCSMCRVSWIRRLVATNNRWLSVARSSSHARRDRI